MIPPERAIILNKKGAPMSLAKDFREFAVKGNVMDLAVGVIIGAAFGKIVDSLVNDLIMPIVGAVFGGLDFSNWVIPLKPVPPNVNVANLYVELKKAGIPFIGLGNFVSILINFMILAFIVFMLVKLFKSMREQEEKKPAPPPEDVLLLREIRDSLKPAPR
jgi:large conductance mechanosensitive channel